MRKPSSADGQGRPGGGKKDTGTGTLSFPINIPPAMNLAAREKDLSFREGLLRKRRADPKSFIQEGSAFRAELRQLQPPKLNPAVLAPAILFHPPPECIRQAREGRLGSDRDRVLHRRSIVLLIYWLSRLDPRAVPFLFTDGSQHSDHDRLHQALTSMTAPGSNTRYSGLYSYGLKIYQGLQMAKTCSFGQLFGPEANPEQSLALFWSDYPKHKKVELAKEALSLMLPALKSAWCNCNCCKYRRMGVADLRDQLLRAYCEELDRFVAADGAIDGPECSSDSRSRKLLYRSITLITAGILTARSRPVFDVLSAFNGLRFTDRPKDGEGGEGGGGGGEGDGTDSTDSEGFIEYSSESEQDYGDEADLYEDGFDPLYGHRHDTGYRDLAGHEMLDFSDDDDAIEAADGELAMDEAELVGPMASASHRHSATSFLGRHRSGVIAEDTGDGEQERQLVEDGKTVFQLFVSEILYNRLILAFWQEETRKQQELLIQEDEEEKRQQRAKPKAPCKSTKKKGKRAKAAVGECRGGGALQEQEAGETAGQVQDDKDGPLAPEQAHDAVQGNDQGRLAQLSETQLEQLINEGLAEMALLDAHDLLPPGFEGAACPVDDDFAHDLPPGFSCSQRVDHVSEVYNYLTSSPFGPTLLDSIIG